MPGMGMRDPSVLVLTGFCLSFIHAVGYLGFDRSLSLALPVTWYFPLTGGMEIAWETGRLGDWDWVGFLRGLWVGESSVTDQFLYDESQDQNL